MRLSYVPFLYEGGHGVEQDYAKVREHFKLAAKQGLIDTREALEALEVLDLLARLNKKAIDSVQLIHAFSLYHFQNC